MNRAKQSRRWVRRAGRWWQGASRRPGLTVTFLADLILKQILLVGEFTQAQVAAGTGLSLPVVDQAIEVLRRERLVDVKGMGETQKLTYRFAITDRGRNRGNDLMKICRYTGPAPVPLEDYRRQTAAQSIRHMRVSKALVNEAFADMIIEGSLRDRLGPAIAAGQTILLYGPTGNGKTTIAEAVGAMLPDIIHVPHALLVGGEIVTVFDPASHRRVATEEKAGWSLGGHQAAGGQGGGGIFFALAGHRLQPGGWIL